MRRLFVIALLLAVGQFARAQERSTWDVIRHDIFGSNCASCHASGSSFGKQSDLVLTPDEAYQQLIDVVPLNPAAAADGLVRVSSSTGIVGLSKSYLWEKINTRDADHFYADHADYGVQMPIGTSLTNGELDFVADWLWSGAPETGVVADTALLENTSLPGFPEFEPLPAPEQGIQLHLGPYDVWSAEKWDREFYHFQPLQIDEPIYIDKIESRYRDGSHHFILQHYDGSDITPPPGEFRDVRDQNGANTFPSNDATRHAEWLFVTQVPNFSYEFPEGVALELTSTAGFDFNMHHVNRTGETQVGEVYVNLHTVDRSEVQHLAKLNFFSNYDLNIPPESVTTISREFEFETTEHIVQMWTHAHETMVEFRVEHAGGDRDGELIYWSNDWEHPPLAQFEDPLVFQVGDKVRLVTVYDNPTQERKIWGPKSSDEMQFLFFMSYPLRGDFRANGELDVRDIQALDRELRNGGYDRAMDLNGDGVLDTADKKIWLEDLVGTRVGDANLDGTVGFDDFVEMSQNFGGSGRWNTGDFDNDRQVGFSDFVALSINYGFVRPTSAAVPEPTGWITVMVPLFAWLHLRRRSRAGCHRVSR